MGTFSKWTEIENLVRVPEILSCVKEVVVTEKIHGTSVRFGVVDGIFRVGGRNEEFDFATSNSGAGMGFLGWLREQPDVISKTKDLAASLRKDVIFYGEWFGEGIQKGIRYLISGKGFRTFGVRINEDLESWDEVARLSNLVGLQTVPVLYRGVPTMEIFDKLYKIPSVVAKEGGIDDPVNILEGVVIVAVPMQKLRQNWLIAKYKNPKFAERASEKKEPKDRTVQEEGVIGQATQFIEEFWTPERLVHVLTYLREQGLDVMSPKVIGPAIKGMYEDVMKEGKAEWLVLSEEVKGAVGKLHPRHTKSLLESYWKENILSGV